MILVVDSLSIQFYLQKYTNLIQFSRVGGTLPHTELVMAYIAIQIDSCH